MLKKLISVDLSDPPFKKDNMSQSPITTVPLKPSANQ